MVDTAALAALEHEPTVLESVRAGADLVCISGDKLMGGPQAGIVAGSAQWVGRVRQDPLFRVLRCDKLMLAALQETARAYLSTAGDAIPDVPVLTLLAQKEQVLGDRAAHLVDLIGKQAAVGRGLSRCGGGTMPRSAVPSITVDITPAGGNVDALARLLRLGDPPVVGYVANGVLKIDVRTVFPDQDSTLAAAVGVALATALA